MKKWVVCFLFVYLGYTSVLWAQAFQNLDFEDANLSPIPPGQYGGLVSIADAFPYWTGYLGTNQVTQVLQNNFTLGNASIDIFGPDLSTASLLQGQYTLVLQAGQDPFRTFDINLINASLAQVGLVPANAKSIMLEAAGAGTNFTVSFAGQTISLTPLGNGPNYTLFGGDITSFTGQVGELRLSTLSPSGPGVLLDAISFSTEAIPEPSALGLVVAGVLGLFFSKRTHGKTVQ